MRILHTSDWHVGKVLKGQSRRDEQLAVLASVVGIAEEQQPDLVIVAGDLFDTAAPQPDATRIVTRALSALGRGGATVVAIAGNHDNGPALDALRPWADAAGVTVRGTVRDNPQEHILTGETRDGQRWQLVALPFLSQRYAVRATEMFSLSAAEANQTYADHLSRLLTALCAGFTADTVNLITAHVTVVGGSTGGGERDAHTVASYAVPANVFPTSTHYVALGHLHRAQTVAAPCPVRYSGSPFAVDFGEEENTPSVTIVDVTASTPARVHEIPIDSAVRLKTLRGTLAQLQEIAAAGTHDDAWLRVFICEPPRAGLREEVGELLPRALDIRIDPQVLADGVARKRTAERSGRAAGALFADYLASKGHDDPAVTELFDHLYAEIMTGSGH